VIIKITRGVSAVRALAYDYGPGRINEHHRPRRINGTVAGRDWRARARTMQSQLRDAGDARKGGQQRVYRLAVRAAPGDRIMSDREWSAIAGTVVERFTGDAANHAWECVRHDRDHVHITLLQRGHDGKLFASRNDYFRGQRIAAQIEAEHDLTRVDHTPVRGDPARRKAIRRANREAREAWRAKGRERQQDRTEPADAARPLTHEERVAAAMVRTERKAAERRKAERDRERGGRER